LLAQNARCINKIKILLLKFQDKYKIIYLINMKSNLQPRIENFPEKKLIGNRIKTSLLNEAEGGLWQNFVQKRKKIKNSIGLEAYSVHIYNNENFNVFNPAAEFEKWAAVQVADFNEIPPEMEPLVVPAGLYAVFLYQGKSSKALEFINDIFGKWLPDSGYALDNRPYLSVLGEKYKYDDVNSEEQIWIPIKKI
jgi:AraC family transcriptional regulator